MSNRGGQEGNNNAGKNKAWKTALNKVLRDYNQGKGSKVENYWALQKIGEKLVDLALEGDMQAIKEIGDRVDGRPAQTTEIVGDSDLPLVTKVVMEVVDGTADSGSS